MIWYFFSQDNVMKTTVSAGLESGLLGTDMLGSPTRKASGSKKTQVSYAPFGHTPDLDAGSVGYTGQMKEPETGLYLLGNGYRGYSPTLMRFTASDEVSPFGKGGLNSYAYCNSQPITRFDTNGQSWASLVQVFTGMALAGGTASLVVGFAAREQLGEYAEAFIIGGGVLVGIGAVGAVGLGVRRRLTAPARRDAKALRAQKLNKAAEKREAVLRHLDDKQQQHAETNAWTTPGNRFRDQDALDQITRENARTRKFIDKRQRQLRKSEFGF